MDSKLSSSNHGASLNDPETRSTISSADLLPGYSPRIESTALTVAKLISRTLLLITLIISLMVLIAVYIQSKNYNTRCDYGISAKESRNGAYFEPLTSESEESSDPGYESPMGNIVGGAGGGRKIPISIRMSGRAGDLMNAAPNGKGHVNCVIERKTANQIIASEPKKLFTPFGNITTDPRLVHLTGEKLVFSCHSGEKEDKDDKEKEVIIITSNKEIMDGNNKDGHEDKGDNSEDSSDSSSIERDTPSLAGDKSGNLKENEVSLNSVRNRKKRSINKELTCSCSN